jgi:hypothetical protein
MYHHQHQWKLQASIARGNPEGAVNSYKKTLSNVATEVAVMRRNTIASYTGDSRREAFTLWTLEQLTQL